MKDVSIARARVFNCEPFCVVQHFPQHQTAVSSLPTREKLKIAHAADFIVNSIRDPVSTGGMVTAIGVRGHADVDHQRTGAGRVEFERNVSRDRAMSVSSALIEEIKRRAFRLCETALPQGEPYEPFIEAMGAGLPAVQNPQNEASRQLNRRVEIFLLRDLTLLLPRNNFDVPAQKSFKRA